MYLLVQFLTWIINNLRKSFKARKLEFAKHLALAYVSKRTNN